MFRQIARHVTRKTTAQRPAWSSLTRRLSVRQTQCLVHTSTKKNAVCTSNTHRVTSAASARANARVLPMSSQNVLGPDHILPTSTAQNFTRSAVASL
jgi:hypothetical protein